MKKLFTTICLCVVLFSASAQKKVAYVTKGSPVDAILIGLQTAASSSGGTWTVTALDLATETTNIGTTITSGNYDLVIISEWPGSGDAGMAELEALTATKPILMMKVHAYGATAPRWNWATTFNNTTSTGVDVSAPTHPIFTGITITSPLAILSQSGANGLTYVDKSTFLPSGVGSSVTTLANITGQSSQQCIVEVPIGTVIGGVTTGQKFIQFGINSVSYQYITSDGAKILANSVLYLTGLLTHTKNKMAENAFSLAPNPSNGEFTINFDQKSSDATVEVKAMDGRTVYNAAVQADAMNVNLSTLTPGIYFVTYTSNNTSGTKKVVIK